MYLQIQAGQRGEKNVRMRAWTNFGLAEGCQLYRLRLDYWPWSASYLALVLAVPLYKLGGWATHPRTHAVPAAGMYKIFKHKELLLLN